MNSEFQQDWLEAVYKQCRVVDLDKSHLTFEDIQPVLNQLSQCAYIDIRLLGLSFEKRDIYEVTVGNGPIRVLAWSQMHGDEPTATASLLDFLVLLSSEEGAHWFEQWRDKLTLIFVPMLNPDGANKRTRENAQGIDINRDANKRQSPEGALLYNLIKHLSPQLAFNLHDQSRYYTVNRQGPETALAFMAPPADKENSLTPARLKAKQLIGLCVEHLAADIQPNLARYDDEYSNRAFGDFVSALELSCILVESGRVGGDPHRQIARKSNVCILFTAINALNHGHNLAGKEVIYDNLPVNVENGITDIVLRQVGLGNSNTLNYLADINIQLDVHSHTSAIKELGDLSSMRGYFEFDASGFQLEPAMVFRPESPITLDTKRFLDLMKNGFLMFENEKMDIVNQTDFPLAIDQQLGHSEHSLSLGQQATFALAKENVIYFAVINGIIIDIKQGLALNSYTY